MIYVVQWSRRALGAVTELWLASSSADRTLITRAVATIDERLGNDPKRLGESRDANERIWFVPPLIVIFEVDDVDRLVRVLNVRPLRRRG